MPPSATGIGGFRRSCRRTSVFARRAGRAVPRTVGRDASDLRQDLPQACLSAGAGAGHRNRTRPGRRCAHADAVSAASGGVEPRLAAIDAEIDRLSRLRVQPAQRTGRA
ncbi:hypothetical protein QF027_009529 [Streptomyces canus]|nr:hypothetical protein [Streptomyces canus]